MVERLRAALIVRKPWSASLSAASSEKLKPALAEKVVNSLEASEGLRNRVALTADHATLAAGQAFRVFRVPPD
jgi:hypothetical protein